MVSGCIFCQSFLSLQCKLKVIWLIAEDEGHHENEFQYSLKCVNHQFWRKALSMNDKIINSLAICSLYKIKRDKCNYRLYMMSLIMQYIQSKMKNKLFDVLMRIYTLVLLHFIFKWWRNTDIEDIQIIIDM